MALGRYRAPDQLHLEDRGMFELLKKTIAAGGSTLPERPTESNPLLEDEEVQL